MAQAKNITGANWTQTNGTLATTVTTAVSGGQGYSYLTGFSHYLAPASELWPNATAAGYLVQTNPAIAPAFEVDLGANVFAGGNTYQRHSVWVRCIKNDNQIGTIAGGGTSEGSFNLVTANAITASISIKVLAPYTDPLPFADTLSGICASINIGSMANAGTEGLWSHTEAGRLSRTTAGSATASTNGYYNPNMPFGEWVLWTFIIDKATQRVYFFINNHLVSFYSLLSLTSITTDYFITLPVLAGCVWHLGAATSWTDTSIANDTGLAPITNTANWKIAGISPTWSPIAPNNSLVPKFTLTGLTNMTAAFIPQSNASGTRPCKEEVVLTATAGSASATKTVAALPISFNSDGICNVTTNMRFGAADNTVNGNTWGFSLGFTAGASFILTYTGGAYTLKDAANATLGTWNINEKVQWVLTIRSNGTVTSTIHNLSRNSCATANGNTSTPVTLHASDTVPSTTFSLTGTVTANAASEYASFESWQSLRIFSPLLADSFVETTMQGTTAFNVAKWIQTYPPAVTGDLPARATISSSVIYPMHLMQADCNPHGSCTYPSGSQFPRWSFSEAWGRSGNKITNYVTYNVDTGALNNLYGCTPTIFGGIHNDVAGATDDATATSIATSIATAFTKLTQTCLDRSGGLIWIRTPYQIAQPNATPANTLPAASAGNPMTGWVRVCHDRTLVAVTTALRTLQRRHPRGYKVVIADSGRIDVEGAGGGSLGIHPTITGSPSAFVTAAAQVGALLGESFTPGSTTEAARVDFNLYNRPARPAPYPARG